MQYRPQQHGQHPGDCVTVLQINLNHCEAANDLMYRTAQEEKASVAIISEPYRTDGAGRWHTSSDRLAAVVILDSNMNAKPITSGRGIVAVEANGISYMSCYCSPNVSDQEYEDFLDGIERAVRAKPAGTGWCIAGDFNAWSTLWGSRETREWGTAVEEMMAATNLTCCNVGSEPTFVKGSRSSTVDLTLATPGLARLIKNWGVSGKHSESDHKYLIYNIEGNRGSSLRRKPAATRWVVRKLNEEKFREVFGAKLSCQQQHQQQQHHQRQHRPSEESATAEEAAMELTRRLTKACNASMPKAGNRKMPPVYWWNEGIATQRKLCTAARRKIARLRRRGETAANVEIAEEEFRSQRKKLRGLIKKSKGDCWRSLISEIEHDPWGMPYKIVMGKLRGGNANPPPQDRLSLERITAELFPGDNVPDYAAVLGEQTSREEWEPFSEAEVRAAVRKTKNKKAAGPDGIPGEAIKLAHACDPGALRLVFNRCLNEGTFPTSWKEARLVLLPKGKPDQNGNTAYRPLCLLDNIGKAYERLLVARIERHLEMCEGLSRSQYGFRRGRSTIDAILETQRVAKEQLNNLGFCVAVAIDIRNAFNSARWIEVIAAMKSMRVPEYLIRVTCSYLSDRKLRVETEDGTWTMGVARGVPQGSVMGPLLWNIMFNGLFTLQLPLCTRLVCFADDTLIVTTGLAPKVVERRANNALRTVTEWVEGRGLKVAANKTEAIMFTRKKIFKPPKLVIKGQRLEIKNSIKYLGVIMDRKLNYGPHIQYAVEKARNTANRLGRLMPNIGGPKQMRRRLLASVMNSVALYGAPVWAEAVRTGSNAGALLSLQRQMVLRTICGYRSISTDAALVIAGTPPLDMMADERRRTYRRNKRPDGVKRSIIAKEEKRRTTEKWRLRWNSSTKGRWTHTLINDLGAWIGRKHGETNYWVTQVLSGHGSTKDYLWSRRRADSPACTYCGAENETVEHTLFLCPRWAELRSRAIPSGRDSISPATIVPVALGSRRDWDVTMEGLGKIMNEKEVMERLEQGRR